MNMAEASESRWLLLLHQIPPKPAYFRVKIWRRLQRLGAVAIKNSVYALPRNDQSQEDFQWVLREIVAGGGDASICEARFVDGLTEEQLQAMFHAARDADYLQLAEEARHLAERLPADAGRTMLDNEVVRLKRRLDDINAIDFFGAPGREAAEGMLASLEGEVRMRIEANVTDAKKERPGSFRERTWVTRKGIHVDRIASAWLIRKFIDSEARFKFVPAKGYKPEKGELRFDMFEAEYTHEGDRCTFEVLLERFSLDQPALRAIAELVHDIDLKDDKFGRDGVAGFAHLIAGICLAQRDDVGRLARGAAVLDDLYAYYGRKKG
jgi:hypothetical protein